MLEGHAKEIYDRVMEVLQEAEEMGGVSSDDQYAELMNSIAKECNERTLNNIRSRS